MISNSGLWEAPNILCLFIFLPAGEHVVYPYMLDETTRNEDK